MLIIAMIAANRLINDNNSNSTSTIDSSQCLITNPPLDVSCLMFPTAAGVVSLPFRQLSSLFVAAKCL